MRTWLRCISSIQQQTWLRIRHDLPQPKPQNPKVMHPQPHCPVSQSIQSSPMAHLPRVRPTTTNLPSTSTQLPARNLPHSRNMLLFFCAATLVPQRDQPNTDYSLPSHFQHLQRPPTYTNQHVICNRVHGEMTPSTHSDARTRSRGLPYLPTIGARAFGVRINPDYRVPCTVHRLNPAVHTLPWLNMCNRDPCLVVRVLAHAPSVAETSLLHTAPTPHPHQIALVATFAFTSTSAHPLSFTGAAWTSEVDGIADRARRSMSTEAFGLWPPANWTYVSESYGGNCTTIKGVRSYDVVASPRTLYCKLSFESCLSLRSCLSPA
jgi:hypothetical protein